MNCASPLPSVLKGSYMNEDYYKAYFRYAGAGVSEPPNVFHRWGATSIIGTLLGRQFYFPFGHSRIFPNQFVTLMGPPGARKSTAINIAAKLLKGQGYTRFAADRVSKERFLMDMSQYEEQLGADDLEALTLEEPAEVFVVAEEFTDFVGNNNMEFITMLTKLWDCPSEYKNPKIHGASVVIHEPTVNILAGNTAQGFALAFPPEALGNGFLSRMIFIHGETTGRKITFPPKPDELLQSFLVEHLKEVKAKVKGEAVVGPVTRALCDRIYNEFKDIDDTRFKHYSTRRFTHLLKLGIIIAASNLRTEIKEEDILKANTMLHYAETKMSKALGEFGKSKYSDISNTILDLLHHAHSPMNMKELWIKVSKDLTKIADLGEIVKNLQHAGKIQTVTIKGKQGLLPMHAHQEGWDSSLLMPEWLTEEELGIL